jgi:hypothetical protein
MKPKTYRDVQNRLARYVSGRITLRALQNWLAPIAWKASEEPELPLARLIYKIELRIAEYDAGHLSRKDFIAELTELALGKLNVETATSSTIDSNVPHSPPFIELRHVARNEFSSVCGTLSLTQR